MDGHVLWPSDDQIRQLGENKTMSMWKKRREDEQMPEPEVARTIVETPPPIAPPPRLVPPPRTEARIGASVVIKGQIFAEEDLCLDGEIEGSVDLPESRLTIGKSGKVQANIKAREVDIVGSVRGDIHAADKITIRKDANLIGNLKSATISIEDGAFFKGSIDIVRPAPVRAAAPQPPPAPVPASAPAPRAVVGSAGAGQSGGRP
jgi:cytoskeletal protein CcmA (bactofilin family)